MTYLLVFFAVGLIIILHELGHFLAAKWVGIPIARFSIGFGPKLCAFKLRETEFRVSMIPCGGYVMPALEDDDAHEKMPFRSRVVFALGGPVANILGAFCCLALLNVTRLGLSIDAVVILPLQQIGTMAMQLCALIPLLFTQPEQLSGIVGIVAAGGAHVGLDFSRLLQFSVLLNLNLAIFNLLPVPPLDGGKIVMGLLRKIHQPLRKLELPLTVGGWALLLGLMLYATVLDVTRMTQGVWG